jgi:hypothetical protein
VVKIRFTEFTLQGNRMNTVECLGESSARPSGTRDHGRDAVPRVPSAVADLTLGYSRPLPPGVNSAVTRDKGRKKPTLGNKKYLRDCPGLACEMPERHSRRMISAHPVNAATGRSGRGAQIQVGSAGGVIAQGRAEEELPKRQFSAFDIAAYQVGVHGFKQGG